MTKTCDCYGSCPIYSHVGSSIKLLMMMVDMIKSVALQSKKQNKAECQPCYLDNPEI